MSGTAIGSYAPDFEIPGVDGAVHHLAQYLNQFQAVAVVIMCNHCPYVKFYLERLKQIQDEFAAQGVTLIGINPNDEQQFPDDSFEQMKVLAEQQQLNFPYLRDLTQDVARCFGAEKTPQAFLINQSGQLCYRGGIDDSPQDAAQVKQPYLRTAIAQLLAGEPIAVAEAPTVGCSVKWRS
ncbi:MAG: thioredoxin family protein [Pegethrix bostrychoides GSE-TBD4-15B]|jgi:peroxiredoxin|uniref:Thioredoxin family protein n=1 Tax=Pegethrix bostrychoides GSE-TBD4-15B TaxID=2839662 RepID=A0A951U5V3_9CYAN|nr:thioredoxin family protein [Pegethrix bostrychoides GSE-TBD4-15B]